MTGAGLVSRSNERVVNNGQPPAPNPLSGPDSEVLERAQRRTFTGAYKLRILAEADACAAGSGNLGVLLRREGLYSSHLTTWRKQRDAGAFQALAPKPRGRKRHDPVQAQLEELQRENARLQRQLEQAQTIVEFQKKVCTLLEIPLAIQSSGERSA